MGAVFLSYASQDADAALGTCESLRAAGIEVWLDQSELRGGDAWDSAIRKQIKTCALFLPVISATTSARPEGYFRLEWKLAVDRSHLIAPEFDSSASRAASRSCAGGRQLSARTGNWVSQLARPEAAIRDRMQLQYCEPSTT